MRAFIVHSVKACPERACAVDALREELNRVFPGAVVEVVSGHEPDSCDPEHAKAWCNGGSVEAVSRLLKHVDALVAAASREGRSLILEDDVRIDDAPALVAAVEGTGVVQLAGGGSAAYCMDASTADKMLAYLRMAPKVADFQARLKGALTVLGVGSRRVDACSDGSTVGRHTPSVRSGKVLDVDCRSLTETERLLKTFPMHPYASLAHAVKLKESGDYMGSLKVCRAALDTFRTKPDGVGDTPLIRFIIELFQCF